MGFVIFVIASNFVAHFLDVYSFVVVLWVCCSFNCRFHVSAFCCRFDFFCLSYFSRRLQIPCHFQVDIVYWNSCLDRVVLYVVLLQSFIRFFVVLTIVSFIKHLGLTVAVYWLSFSRTNVRASLEYTLQLRLYGVARRADEPPLRLHRKL